MTKVLISHPLVPKGVPMNPLSETTFPVEFSDKNYTIDRVPQIMHVCEKKWKSVPFQNFTDFPSTWLLTLLNIEDILYSLKLFVYMYKFSI